VPTGNERQVGKTLERVSEPAEPQREYRRTIEAVGLRRRGGHLLPSAAAMDEHHNGRVTFRDRQLPFKIYLSRSYYHIRALNDAFTTRARPLRTAYAGSDSLFGPW
jgi:hypothetical protein